jgi:hypothetical protein
MLKPALARGEAALRRRDDARRISQMVEDGAPSPFRRCSSTTVGRGQILRGFKPCLIHHNARSGSRDLAAATLRTVTSDRQLPDKASTYR